MSKKGKKKNSTNTTVTLHWHKNCERCRCFKFSFPYGPMLTNADKTVIKKNENNDKKSGDMQDRYLFLSTFLHDLALLLGLKVCEK